MYTDYAVNYRANVSVELVDKCISGMKRGKAAGLDRLTVEHILYSHPVLVVHLSVLFNILLAYGVVPYAFGHGVIMPLIKDADGD